jgi:hypothetical protein
MADIFDDQKEALVWRAAALNCQIFIANAVKNRKAFVCALFIEICVNLVNPIIVDFVILDYRFRLVQLVK